MAITIGAVTLPSDLRWADEFDTSQIAQNTQRSLSGALVISESVKTEGRSIKLTGDDEGAWISRSVLLQLRALAEQNNTNHVLDLNGTSFNVRFDRSNGSGITAKQIINCSDPGASDNYTLELSLFTV
jgi:hypothetical protein